MESPAIGIARNKFHKTKIVTENNNEQEKEKSLALWEVFQGVFAMFIGVQSEENRERQFKYGKLHQFIFVGIVVTIVFVVHIILIVKYVLEWAGV